MIQCGVRAAATGALALLVAGCSVEPRWTAPPGPPLHAGRSAREQQLNADWQDHTMRELVDTFGPPRLMLDIPGGGSPPGFVLVYARDAGSGCIDAFMVASGEVLRVRGYQCR